MKWGLASTESDALNRSESTPLIRRAAYASLVVMTVYAVIYVLMYGHPLPIEDEFVNTLHLVQGTFPDLSQIWAQHNEHRIPFARLAYHFIANAASGDSRAVMMGTVLLLAGGAFFLVRAAAELRGRASWWDMLLPLLLLHPGHRATLLNAFQICFAFYAFWLALLLYGMAVSQRNVRTSLLMSGGALCGLILTCSGGVVLSAASLPWLVLATIAVSRSNSPDRMKDVRLGIGVIVTVLILMVLYMYGLKTNVYPHEATLSARVETTQYFIANGIGSSGARFPEIVSSVLIAVSILAGVLWIKDWKHSRASLAVTGWLLIGGGILGMAVVFGYKRAAFGPAQGGMSRYSILTVPLIAILVVSLSLWSSKVGRLGHTIIVLVVLLAIPMNTVDSVTFGRKRAEMYERVMTDYRRGAGFHTIAKYYDSKNAMGLDTVARGLEGLQQRRLSAFVKEPFVPQQGTQPPRGP